MSTTLVELIAAGIFLVCILDGIHKGLLLKVFSLLRIIVVLALTMILVPVLKPLFAANSEVQIPALGTETGSPRLSPAPAAQSMYYILHFSNIVLSPIISRQEYVLRTYS